MPTGIEIAGVVLAAFPLVIAGVQAWRSGLEPISTWWQYRTEVIKLSAAVGSQHVMFLHNIELLLDPIVTSSVQMDLLLKNAGPGNQAWRNPQVGARVKDRLSISYDSYVNTVGRLMDTLKELESKLGIEDGTVIPPNIQPNIIRSREIKSNGSNSAF